MILYYIYQMQVINQVITEICVIKILLGEIYLDSKISYLIMVMYHLEQFY